MKLTRKKTKKVDAIKAAAPEVAPASKVKETIPSVYGGCAAEESRFPQPVPIEYVEPAAKQVFVAGSFNGWRPDLTPLVPFNDGRWKGNLKLDPGRYEYLFVVDGQWRPDPNARESVQNPYGGLNSVITVSV
jgi:1,4-alpha-glucan branching enzyme